MVDNSEINDKLVKVDSLLLLYYYIMYIILLVFMIKYINYEKLKSIVFKVEI